MNEFIAMAMIFGLVGGGTAVAGTDMKNGSESSGTSSFLKTITDYVEFGGSVEVEMNRTDSSISNEETNDISLATVELGLNAVISDWARGHLLLLYEEGADENIVADEATITFGDTEMFPAFLRAGKMYVPFGGYESNMVSDPLPLELGETGDTAVQIGFETGGYYGSVYAYNGDISKIGDDDGINTFGASVGLVLDSDTMFVGLGVDWMSNIGDSDALGDALPAEIEEYVAGIAVHGLFEAGPFTLLAEYVTALDEFEPDDLMFMSGKGAEPSAYLVEAAYSMELFGSRATTFAVGCQGTDEALALELPEERYLAVVSVVLFPYGTVALEYFHDEDYSQNDGGSGKDADSITLKISLEF